jgi:hypothetical protein
MGLPMPWGKSLEPRVRPSQLLELPLAFTQNELLSPDEFAKRAGERGVELRAEHLLELHRRAGPSSPCCALRSARPGHRKL